MATNIIKLELLAPARDLNSAKMAVLAGADAVYIGGPQFSARFAAGNSWQDIWDIVRFAHQYYVKVYLPVNTIFFDNEAESVKETIDKAYKLGVDALIIQDMGIMEMDLPPMQIFASTQNHNYDIEQIKFLEKAGFSRVILARECDLERIKKIKKETNIELESFVHGALCVSFSGRCYFSEALYQRSANRGQCMQACRLLFSLIDADSKELVQDKFLLSLKDLNLSASLKDLIDAGVTSFKIEGRLKNEIYVGNVVAKYRHELDKLINANPQKYQKASSGKIDLDFEPDLDRTFSRGYTNYFLYSRQKDIISLDSQKSLGKFMGKVVNIGKDYFTLDRKTDLKNAYEIGAFCAKKGWVTLTGGRNKGVMNEALKGAKENNGLTIGVLPTDEKELFSDFLDIPIITNMSSGRNYINVLSSDIVIVCGIDSGTSSEISLAIKPGKKIILIGLYEEANTFYKKLAPEQILCVKNSKEAIDFLEKENDILRTLK